MAADVIAKEDHFTELVLAWKVGKQVGITGKVVVEKLPKAEGVRR